MKIGIMADSHDNIPAIKRALERLGAEGAACLIHAGDFIAPFAVREILKFDGPVLGCFGNNDGERQGIRKTFPDVREAPAMLSLGGRSILLVHDAAEATPDLLSRADVMIFAHTHKPLVESVDRCLRINPGETGGWLHGSHTVAMLDTDTLEARILEFQP